ncbi:MAG: TlpA family protein disulfide reductase [Gammaproteobacteria bacterium]|nr:TlpA family protein disulfide reductase [Gammaproteobacteria bacterium]
MKKETLIATTLLLATAALLGYLWLTPSGLKPAPEIRLTTLQGEPLTLAALQGRPVLVTFWATTCPGCIKEMPHLVELYRELAPRGLEIIAIAMAYDPQEQVRTMVAQKQLPYPVAIDSDGSAAQAFGGVSLTPSSFLIDPQGRIVQYKLGEMDMPAVHNRIIAMLGGSGA